MSFISHYRCIYVESTSVACRVYARIGSPLGSGDDLLWPAGIAKFADDSFGGRPGRRMNAINFAEAVVTKEQEAGLREVYEGFTHVLHPAESLVNSDTPRLRAMVSKLVELGFETSKV